MKPQTAAISTALVFTVIGYFVALSLGFTGFIEAPIIGAVGSTFGLLIAAVGPKAFWLPAGGSLVGLFGMLLVQVLSSPTLFPLGYYVYVSLLAGIVITLVASLTLQLIPALRKRIFGVSANQQ